MDDVACHLPMPWDSHGVDFSNALATRKVYETYISKLSISETVEVVFSRLLLSTFSLLNDTIFGFTFVGFDGRWTRSQYIQSYCNPGGASQGESEHSLG